MEAVIRPHGGPEPGAQAARFRLDLKWVILGLCVVAVAYLAVIPLGFLLWQSFFTPQTAAKPAVFTLQNYATAYTSLETAKLFLNSLLFAIALAVVLSNIKLFKIWGQGGSVTLASMVPIFVVALRWGAPAGIVAGVLDGILQYLLEPIFVHPLQWLLDYPVAFGALGLAGLLPRQPLPGIVIGGAARWLAHVLSGVVYFASYAPPGQSPWVYSALYNGSYMLPEVVISVAVGYLVLAQLQRLQPAMR